ncbi:hypothetical protein ABZ917_23485 [Nonomuraea wenchangensis]
MTPPGGRAYELDLPANVADKRRLRALPGGAPERVRLIEVDFETADLADVLADFLADGGHGAAALHEEFVAKRRVWRFGLAPDEVGPLLERHGWAEREQVGVKP